MPKRVVPLTDLQIRNAKSRSAAYKLSDGGGLFLEVTPTGGKLWRLKYCRPNGKENKLHLGAYPSVSLIDARALRDEARKQLAAGLDPVQAREERAASERAAAANTFELVAREWHRVTLKQWQPHTAANILHRLQKDIFPFVGSKPIAQISTADLLIPLRLIEARGAPEIARRVAQNCKRVFNFADDTGLILRNPAERLVRALEAREEGHFAAITVYELPEFLRRFRSNEVCMGLVTHICMDIMMRVFVRTSELIETPWSEINLQEETWVIPWRRMKRGRLKVKPDKRDHDVCAPKQVWELLRRLHVLTGSGKYVFPNMRDPDRPASNGLLLKALERMGYRGGMTGHGFRALAMSALKEQLRYRHEVVDRQLAHAQKNKTDSAYDRAHYLAERREMMQAWSDFIDRQ
jgi:integrase